MNDSTGTYSYIKTDTCDVCGQSSSGVMNYHLGTPVLFVCGVCDRGLYETVGELEKEQWLEGQWDS